MPLDTTIEALLFAAGEPLSIAHVRKLTSASLADVHAALNVLQSRLAGGITLVCTETTAALAVAPGSEEIVNQLIGDPEDREIGQAGLEVLSILLYQGASTRALIDYIRGVNSTSSIRTLLMRNLIERTRGENGREIIYQPTVELLAHLGITSTKNLPDREEMQTALATFLARGEEQQNHGTESTTNI